MTSKRKLEGLPQWVTFDSKETPFSQLGDEDLDDVPPLPIALKKHKIRRSFSGENVLGKRHLFMDPAFVNTFKDEDYLLSGRIIECPSKTNQYRYRVRWSCKSSHDILTKETDVEIPTNVREYFHRKDSELLWTAVKFWKKHYFDQVETYCKRLDEEDERMLIDSRKLIDTKNVAVF